MERGGAVGVGGGRVVQWQIERLNPPERQVKRFRVLLFKKEEKKKSR